MIFPLSKMTDNIKKTKYFHGFLTSLMPSKIAVWQDILDSNWINIVDKSSRMTNFHSRQLKNEKFKVLYNDIILFLMIKENFEFFVEMTCCHLLFLNIIQPVVAVGSGAVALEPVGADRFLVEGCGLVSEGTPRALGTARPGIEVITVVQIDQTHF